MRIFKHDGRQVEEIHKYDNYVMIYFTDGEIMEVHADFDGDITVYH